MSESVESASGSENAEVPKQQTPEPVQTAPATPATPAVRAPEYVTVGLLYKVVFLVAIMSSLSAVFTYDRVFATKVQVFDLQEYLTKIRTDSANNKLTPEQYKGRLDRLESSVMSVPKNTIIITGDVILGKNAKRLNVPAE